jgi:hypothetical protein
MLISKAWDEDLWVDYFQKSTQSSEATPIGCTFGAPNRFLIPKDKMLTSKAWYDDKTLISKASNEDLWGDCFYWVTQSLWATLKRSTFGMPIARVEIMPQTRELDLESLGWLFQNQLKDWGLVGDKYPLGPLEGKKASQGALGLLSR